jgi:hypothetical protein
VRRKPIAETLRAVHELRKAAKNGDEVARAALEQAKREDEEFWQAEDAFWRSDPLMGAAGADERARRQARIGGAIALRLLSRHAARAPQVPRRSRGRAPRTRRVRVHSGSRGDPPSSSSEDDDEDDGPGRALARPLDVPSRRAA